MDARVPTAQRMQMGGAAN
jgi:intraflagellar transport protein 74